MSTRRYYCKMSDDSVVDFIAPNAAQALCIALETCLGRTIKECWSGDASRRPEIGFTEYEIPNHVALEAPPRRMRKLPDNTVTMFDDAPRRTEGRPGAHQDA